MVTEVDVDSGVLRSRRLPTWSGQQHFRQKLAAWLVIGHGGNGTTNGGGQRVPSGLGLHRGRYTSGRPACRWLRIERRGPGLRRERGC